MAGSSAWGMEAAGMILFLSAKIKRNHQRENLTSGGVELTSLGKYGMVRNNKAERC
jgi:hypothetical protein